MAIPKHHGHASPRPYQPSGAQSPALGLCSTPFAPHSWGKKNRKLGTSQTPGRRLLLYLSFRQPQTSGRRLRQTEGLAISTHKGQDVPRLYWPLGRAKGRSPSAFSSIPQEWGIKGVDVPYDLNRRWSTACGKDGLLAGLDEGPYTSILNMLGVVY